MHPIQSSVESKTAFEEIEKRPHFALCGMTDRQVECLAWVQEGKSATDIGTILGISRRTVDLSERLGSWTYAGRSRSRPTLLSKGSCSTTESDQRRALMMPQELVQMSARRLLVLRAGIPPIRAEKIVYWRDRAFTVRQWPPPTVPSFGSLGGCGADLTGICNVDGAVSPPAHRDPLSLDLIASVLSENGLEPVPAQGADEVEIEAWLERFIDASARVDRSETSHGR